MDWGGDLKLMVTPLSIKEFPALVKKARVMEKLKAEVEIQRRSQQKVGGPSRSVSIPNDRMKPYFRPQPQGPRRFSHQPQQPQLSRPQCYHCGRPHLTDAGPQLIGKRTCVLFQPQLLIIHIHPISPLTILAMTFQAYKRLIAQDHI